MTASHNCSPVTEGGQVVPPAQLLWLPVVGLVLNAFVWGVSWLPFRALEKLGLSALVATVMVYAVAATLIALRDSSVFKNMWQHPALWLIALGSGCTNATFNYAVTIGEVTRVVLLFYLMPVWTALLARLLLHEPIRPAVALRILVALAGAMIVLTKGQWMLPVPQGWVDWLAIIGGFSFALNNVMLRRLHQQSSAARSFAMFIGGVLFAGIFAVTLWYLGRIPTPAPVAQAWWWLAGLTVAFLAANLALQYGATRLSANVTALVMLSEIIFASVSAAWIAGEKMSSATLLGGSLIVVAALMAAMD